MEKPYLVLLNNENGDLFSNTYTTLEDVKNCKILKHFQDDIIGVYEISKSLNYSQLISE